MDNKGLNEVKVLAGDVPNIGSPFNSSSNQPSIRGEAVDFCAISNLEFSYNCSGIRVLNCDITPIA